MSKALAEALLILLIPAAIYLIANHVKFVKLFPKDEDQDK